MLDSKSPLGFMVLVLDLSFLVSFLILASFLPSIVAYLKTFHTTQTFSWLILPPFSCSIFVNVLIVGRYSYHPSHLKAQKSSR